MLVASGASNGSEFDTVIVQAAAIHPLLEKINRLWLKIYAEKSEKIFGGGEQYTYFNLRGRDYPIWTREQGTLLVPSTPLHFGSYMVLNFTATDYHEVFVHSASLTLELDYDNTALGLVQKVYKRAGTQPPLPDWVLGGAILGLEDGTEEVNCSALLLQLSKGGRSERERPLAAGLMLYLPGLDEVVQELATDGVRVTVYCNPHLIQGSPMFEEAAAAGHLMRDRDGQIFLLDFGGFYGGTVDVHYTPSANWYAGE
ncbi:hypothetical protein HAZT_HAZT008439 [Hyalella azteca]|uniref:Glycoside hydrolase family 31 N-terminal domain-containing protein n=1 Tax=Hyalella azteca TaxID=294128 RepID=A0A6A0H261_HYAAZ|nr:hypothetical protein HAZT_HAZT008439 [Hyalella azteca]